MNKEKLIFFGAIGVVVLIMVIYGVSVFSKKTTSSAAVDFTVPDLVEKDKTKEEYDNRLKKANDYQEPQEKRDLSKTVNFKTYKSEPKKEEKKVVTVTEFKKTVTRKIETEKINQKVTIESKPEEMVKKSDDPGGFGIVVPDRTDNKKTQPNSQAKNSGFISAMLEEDTKIRNQTSVVFFLLEDFTIDGIIFKKNSILYGKASEYSGVFDIKIFQIMNTDGVISSVNGIIVYDEKYSRGLAYEGNLNESVKEGMSQTTNETSSSISSNITGTGVGIAANAVDNTIKAITRKKEASINLYKGYKVFIKKE